MLYLVLFQICSFIFNNLFPSLIFSFIFFNYRKRNVLFLVSNNSNICSLCGSTLTVCFFCLALLLVTCFLMHFVLFDLKLLFFGSLSMGIQGLVFVYAGHLGALLSQDHLNKLKFWLRVFFGHHIDNVGSNLCEDGLMAEILRGNIFLSTTAKI